MDRHVTLPSTTHEEKIENVEAFRSFEERLYIKEFTSTFIKSKILLCSKIFFDFVM